MYRYLELQNGSTSSVQPKYCSATTEFNPETVRLKIVRCNWVSLPSLQLLQNMIKLDVLRPPYQPIVGLASLALELAYLAACQVLPLDYTH